MRLEQREKWWRDSAHFVVIDGRRLERECFFRSMRLLHPDIHLIGCESVESYLGALLSGPPPDALILRVDQNGLSEPGAHALIRHLVEQVAPVPVMALSDCEDVSQMVAILDCGVSGCIPASIGLEAIVEAVRLAFAGCFLLTSEGQSALRHMMAKEAKALKSPGKELTSRQTAVAEALRRGKSNKMIAYELNMCENTVKVHVRNILKKLQVTNRTEAAFKLNAATQVTH